MSKSDKSRWRVGNFVYRYTEVPTLGEEDWDLSENQVRNRVRKGQIGTVRALEVSSLDGAWRVRFQPGSQMELILKALLDGDDQEYLQMVTVNLFHIGMIPNGYFHQALTLLIGAYYDPSLLDGGVFNRKSRQFRKDAKAIRDKFLAWYEDSKRVLADREDDGKYDETRLRAEQLLGEE